MKNLFLLTVSVAILAVACNSAGNSGSETAKMSMISELVSEPMSHEGEEVTIEGTITHVCRHSGDKMRVNQSDDQDFSIMVMLNDFQSQFGPEFEGSHIKLNGVFKTEIIEAEAEHTHNHDHDHAHEGHNHSHEEGGDHECESTQQANEKLKEKGIDPKVFAFVEMTSFEIVNDQQ